MFGTLILIGLALGSFMGAMAHPKFYAAVFGGRSRSADHDPRDG